MVGNSQGAIMELMMKEYPGRVKADATDKVLQVDKMEFTIFSE